MYGKQSGYLKMIAQTRDAALAQLADHAQSLGANAVLDMRFDSGEFDAGQGQAMNEVTAYGTAVVVETPRDFGSGSGFTACLIPDRSTQSASTVHNGHPIQHHRTVRS